MVSENGMIVGKKEKKLLLLGLCAAVGVFLLIRGSVGVSKNTEDEESRAASVSVRDPSLYAAQVEAQVVAICSRVEGVGNVSAVVTLRGGYQTLYASDSQSSSSGYKSSTVLVGSGSSEQAVPIGYDNPEIAGIGIVCSGGDRPEIRREILSLVSAAFHIGTNKIYIAGGQVS